MKSFFSIGLTENEALEYVILYNGISTCGFFSSKFVKECENLKNIFDASSSKLIFKSKEECGKYYLIFLALVEMFEIGRNWFPFKGGYIDVSFYKMINKIVYLLESKCN